MSSNNKELKLEERLDLLRKNKPSVIFNLLLNTGPLNQKEIEVLLARKGKPGNSHIRYTIKKLEKAAYIEKTPDKRRPILRCKTHYRELPEYSYPDNPWELELKVGKIPRNDQRYRVTTKFLEDLVEKINKNRDREELKYHPKIKYEDLLNEIKIRTEMHIEQPFVSQDFSQAKPQDIIEILQMKFLGWFLQREYITNIFKSRKAIDNIYQKIGPPQNRFTFVPQNSIEFSQALEDIIEADVESVMKPLLNSKTVSVDEARTAIEDSQYLPKDKILDELNQLFVFTYPSLSKHSRQRLKYKWGKIMEKER